MKPQKRERPPMPPVAVRLQVALRQLGWRPEQIEKGLLSEHHRAGGMGHGKYLAVLLADLAGQLSCIDEIDVTKLALDHDPALILRPYNARIRDVAARYTPHAHNPDALIYREKANHQQKTTGRRPGAERTITTKGSDIGLKTKFARLEGHTKPKRKVKIPSRPFPKRKP